MDKTEIGLILLIVVLVILLLILVFVVKGGMIDGCIKRCEEINYTFESIVTKEFFDFYCSCEEKTDKVIKLYQVEK